MDSQYLYKYICLDLAHILLEVLFIFSLPVKSDKYFSMFYSNRYCICMSLSTC